MKRLQYVSEETVWVKIRVLYFSKVIPQIWGNSWKEYKIDNIRLKR